MGLLAPNGRAKREGAVTTPGRDILCQRQIAEGADLEPITLGWLSGEALKKLGGVAVQGILQAILRGRAERARDLLLEELRHGRANIGLDASDVDEAVAALWRYLRAAEEGAARLNLRLMASVIDGQLAAKALHADQFLAWADLIASLSKEEVILLATLLRFERQEQARPKSDPTPKDQYPDKKARRKLIGSVFGSDEEYSLTAQALLRTGLIAANAILISSDIGLGAIYRTTSRMALLARVADFEGVIEREVG
ncbi:hypothetical protein [Xanthobacter sp.]|uniref:hypothetical protein n=1 Tax=Xanthobacter sp. TaxID=35809 RepID=UPI0035B2C234